MCVYFRRLWAMQVGHVQGRVWLWILCPMDRVSSLTTIDYWHLVESNKLSHEYNLCCLALLVISYVFCFPAAPGMGWCWWNMATPHTTRCALRNVSVIISVRDKYRKCHFSVQFLNLLIESTCIVTANATCHLNYIELMITCTIIVILQM